MTLPPRFQKLKELEAGATTGPWSADDGIIYLDSGIQPHVCRTYSYMDIYLENAQFIAEARNQVPDLLQALEIACEALELYKSGKAFYPSMGSGGPAYLALEQIEKLGVKE